MARREDIDTAYWSDPDVLELSAVARALYVWTFTNQRCGMAGVYKVARQQIALETGWDDEQLAAALAELEQAQMAFYDGRVMWVRARVKHLRSRSPNIAKAIRADLTVISAHPYLQDFLDLYGPLEWLREYLPQTLPNPSVDPSPPLPGPPEGSLGLGKGMGLGSGKQLNGGRVSVRAPEAAEVQQRLTDLGSDMAAADVDADLAEAPDSDPLAAVEALEQWSTKQRIGNVRAAFRHKLAAAPKRKPDPLTGAVILRGPTAEDEAVLTRARAAVASAAGADDATLWLEDAWAAGRVETGTLIACPGPKVAWVAQRYAGVMEGVVIVSEARLPQGIREREAV